MSKTIEVDYAGKVNIAKGDNPSILYEHQSQAMFNMSKLNKKNSFRTILVLPTGGGKTKTAVYWLLKEAVNNNKKILWIAHRHFLLEQAQETFRENSYSNLLYNINSFNYRVISGKHDRAVNIKAKDNIIIASKDSLARNLSRLDKWIKNEDEIYFVIDECHHAAAKSYRKIIDYLDDKVENLKLLGLTATPFRTSESEQGILKKIFRDDIVYKEDLKTLINKGILARPRFEECKTDIEIGKNLGVKAIKSIEQLDNLPEDIADEIAKNKNRNNVIVNKYVNNIDKYGQTIVFAINRVHAVALKSLFEARGIPAEYIISGLLEDKKYITIDNSDIENQRKIEAYRNGDVKVLINVNILTEGVDLPNTKTVFLARPTVSSILMTQMIGRALRGERAGGHKYANIVSFIDNWAEKIAWVNAKTLIEGEAEINDVEKTVNERQLRLLSISKIEEFARLIDQTIDHSGEDIPFIKRIPLGIYAFTFIEYNDIDDNRVEKNHQVLVYNSTEEQYCEFIDDLDVLFEEYGIEEEFIPTEKLRELLNLIKESYFDEYMLPKYDEKDIECILKYYAQKGCKPEFIPFDELDRQKLDLTTIAIHIIESDMSRTQEKKYIDKLWEEENSIIRIYFNEKRYFKELINSEIMKIEEEEEIEHEKPSIEKEKRDIKYHTLYEIEKYYPEIYKEIKDYVYDKHMKFGGEYYCNICGYQSKAKTRFQMDHIKPMSKGGLTEIDNLQLLCSRCNRKKGDKY